MKKWLAMALLLLAPALRAGDVALYYLNNAALDWEGSGYRDNSTGGWEIKDKPQGPAFALRWKQSLTRDLDAQIFYVRNKPYYSFENGADGLAALNEQQTGETRIAMNEINIDVRRPLEDSKFGVLAGGQGISEIFNRKDISYWGTPDPSTRGRPSAPWEDTSASTRRAFPPRTAVFTGTWTSPSGITFGRTTR